jgi:hypothetical protein
MQYVVPTSTDNDESERDRGEWHRARASSVLTHLETKPNASTKTLRKSRTGALRKLVGHGASSLPTAPESQLGTMVSLFGFGVHRDRGGVPPGREITQRTTHLPTACRPSSSGRSVRLHRVPLGDATPYLSWRSKHVSRTRKAAAREGSVASNPNPECGRCSLPRVAESQGECACLRHFVPRLRDPASGQQPASQGSECNRLIARAVRMVILCAETVAQLALAALGGRATGHSNRLIESLTRSAITVPWVRVLERHTNPRSHQPRGSQPGNQSGRICRDDVHGRSALASPGHQAR